MMKITPHLIINHYEENGEAKENFAIVTDLKKKHLIKSRIVIALLDQVVIKNESGFEDNEKLMDHYFKKYKDPIASYLATLLIRSGQYPYIAKQLEKFRLQYEQDTSN